MVSKFKLGQQNSFQVQNFFRPDSGATISKEKVLPFKSKRSEVICSKIGRARAIFFQSAGNLRCPRFLKIAVFKFAPLPQCLGPDLFFIGPLDSFRMH